MINGIPFMVIDFIGLNQLETAEDVFAYLLEKHDDFNVATLVEQLELAKNTWELHDSVLDGFDQFINFNIQERD